MLRKPAIRRASPGLRDSKIISQSAPIWGWDALNPEAGMRPDAARELVNWFPQTSTIVTRKGKELWATLDPGESVGTIVSYASPSKSELIGFSLTAIYNLSAQGAPTTITSLSTSNSQWSAVNFTNSAGNFLIAANGDKFIEYNGTTVTSITGVSTPAITGVTTSNIKVVHVFKHRLFMIEKNSFSVWYLAVNAISGAATEFPMGGLFKRGGYLLTMETWTLDAGNGMDDYIVFLTSEGEAAVYQGANPSDATDWKLIGLYYVGTPLGRDSLSQFGGDLLVLTTTGVYPATKLVQSSLLSRESAYTSRIQQAFTDAATSYYQNIGWQAVTYPQQNMLIVNIPEVEGQTSSQYVMNTITGAWCKFTGWNALSIERFGDDIFFSEGQKIYKAWSGDSDDGLAISISCKFAYNYFNSKGTKKFLELIRPLFIVEGGTITLNFSLSEDFHERDSSSTVVFPPPTTGSLWGTGKWGSAKWGSSENTYQDWQTIPGYPGFALSVTLSGSLLDTSISWPSTDFIFQTGVAL